MVAEDSGEELESWNINIGQRLPSLCQHKPCQSVPLGADLQKSKGAVLLSGGGRPGTNEAQVFGVGRLGLLSPALYSLYCLEHVILITLCHTSSLFNSGNNNLQDNCEGQRY